MEEIARPKLPKKASSAFLFAIVALISLGIGAGGTWWFASRYIGKTTDATLNFPKKTMPAASITTPSQVFEIKELGVEMTLPSGLDPSDVYYVIDQTPHPTVNELATVWLTTHSLTAIAPRCIAKLPESFDQQALYGFSQYSKQDTNYGSLEYNMLTKVGQNYYDSGQHQSFCSDSETARTLEDKQFKLLEQAWATLKPIPS